MLYLFIYYFHHGEVSAPVHMPDAMRLFILSCGLEAPQLAELHY